MRFGELNGKSPHYIHKIGIISNYTYEVYIQHFAVEISKLHAFLSIVVDDTIQDNEPNRGISPLPNPDFKFVAANTFVSLKICLTLFLFKCLNIVQQQPIIELAEKILTLKQANPTADTSVLDPNRDTRLSPLQSLPLRNNPHPRRVKYG